MKMLRVSRGGIWWVSGSWNPSIFVVVVRLHWVVSTNIFSEFTNHQLFIVSSSTWSKHGKFLLRVNRLLTACFSFLSDSMQFETCKYEIARLGTTYKNIRQSGKPVHMKTSTLVVPKTETLVWFLYFFFIIFTMPNIEYSRIFINQIYFLGVFIQLPFEILWNLMTFKRCFWNGLVCKQVSSKFRIYSIFFNA